MRTQLSPTLAGTVSVAAAIGAFGVIYGATATTVISPGMAVASSLLLFSGAAQFTVIGLIGAGTAPAAILLAVTILGLRHLPLAAVVRPRLTEDRPRRAVLGLVLTDETVGLGLASPGPAARTMVTVGLAGYGAWLAGTIAGVLGADLLAAAPLASVVFVILFIGLAALTCRSGSDAGRAVAAAATTVALLIAWPAVGALGAILVAIGWAFTVARGRPS